MTLVHDNYVPHFKPQVPYNEIAICTVQIVLGSENYRKRLVTEVKLLGRFFGSNILQQAIENAYYELEGSDEGEVMLILKDGEDNELELDQADQDQFADEEWLAQYVIAMEISGVRYEPYSPDEEESDGHADADATASDET